MRNDTRKRLKTKRKPYSFPGLKVAKPLLDFLNPHEEVFWQRVEGTAGAREVRPVKRIVPPPNRTNLVKILRNLKRLEGLARKHPRNFLSDESREDHTHRRLLLIERVLDRRMSPFATRPGIAINRLTLALKLGEEPPQEFRSWPDGEFFRWVRHSVGIWPPIDMQEIEVFQILELIVRNGWLEKLIVCPVCRRWAWKKKKDQRTCGRVTCRQRTPETIEQRRLNAIYNREHGK
jgi:hypothetical protein